MHFHVSLSKTVVNLVLVEEELSTDDMLLVSFDLQ